MATLEKIRSKAWILVVFIGGALLAFVMGDLIKNGSSIASQSKENILVVDGEKVHYTDFQQQVDARLDQIKQQTGRNLTADEQAQVRQMMLEETTNDILFNAECEKLGLTVSDKEMVDLISGSTISPVIQQISFFRNQQTGQFDRGALLNFLQQIEVADVQGLPQDQVVQILQAKQWWEQTEQEVKKERLTRKYAALVSGAALANTLEAKALYNDNKVSADFDYVAQSYNVIPDSAVSVTDAEIAKLYAGRKTQFKQTATQVIDFIAVNVAPNDADVQAVETKLTEIKSKLDSTVHIAEIVRANSDIPYLDAYVAYKDLNPEAQQFVSHSAVGAVDGPVLTGRTYNVYKLEGEKVAPDSVKLELIGLPAMIDQAQFKTLTDSLIQVVKGGTSFADMATVASGGQTNGDAGWATEAALASSPQFGTQFKDAVFNAPLNTPFVVQAGTGSFLVQVAQKTAPVKKYKLANIQVLVTPSQETKMKIYDGLNKFLTDNKTVDKLKANAETAGYAIQKDVEVTPEQVTIAGIEGSRQVIQWAFNHKKGEISDIKECQDGDYLVVAGVENVLKDGYRSLEAVKPLLQRELLNQKKGEKWVADLKAKGYTTLEQYAEALNAVPQSVKALAFGTNNITGIGQEPVLNVVVPNAKANVITGPVAGKNRGYVVVVTNKNTEGAFDATQALQQAQMQNGYRMYQIMQSPDFLKDGVKIENNSTRFF
ncbi:MAG: SurA N-terminal domain-containing protein [Candidatus Symbiothrix sp.]|jgi:peptidyl-prolyl cis-trans isomerase D|nr:SurA N-terminal domain-containing protein [Candidatus Symbiothrix sp.]